MKNNSLFRKLLLLMVLFLSISGVAQAANCINCVTGSESFPSDWKNYRSQNLSESVLPYVPMRYETGYDYSNTDLSGSSRGYGGQALSAELPFSASSFRISRMCNGSFLAAPGVDLGQKNPLGIYAKPKFTPVKDLATNAMVKANWSGTDFTHANMRYHVIANDILDGSPMTDIDMTGVTLFGENSMSGVKMNHVNMSVDTCTGRGIQWKTHTDRSLIIDTIPADKQPQITDAWRYIWRAGQLAPVGKQILSKVSGAVGWTWVNAPTLTKFDVSANPCMVGLPLPTTTTPTTSTASTTSTTSTSFAVAAPVTRSTTATATAKATN